MVTKLLPLQAFVSGWRVKRPKWRLKYSIGGVDFFAFTLLFSWFALSLPHKTTDLMMDIYKPEIAELLVLVEKAYPKSLHTSTDFDEFSLHLKREMNESVSTSTLKRLWGYVGDSHLPRMQTLDVLSRYIGHAGFKQFCAWLKTSTAYNSSFFSAHQISARELQPGSEVEIGWSPNRYLRLRYEGNDFFQVEEARQSKLLQGDRFEAVSFLMGQPLFLPYVLRNGERLSPFIAGRNGGLTLLNSVVHG